MITRLVIGALLLASIGLIVIEMSRWRDPAYRNALSGSQKARRIVGSLLLLIVLGMAYGGTYFPSHPSSQLTASIELLYWLFCLLIAVFLPLVAYLEAKASLTRYADERREARQSATEGMDDLIRQALGGNKAGPEPPKNGQGR